MNMVKLNKPAKLTTGNKVKCVARSISSEFRRGTELPKVVVTTLNEMHRKTGVTNLCKIEEELVREYVNVLVNRVDNEEIEPGTATNRISALNRILEYAERNDLRVSAKEYGLRGVSYWELSSPFPQNWTVQENNFRVRKLR